jgi:hypothetical protein
MAAEIDTRPRCDGCGRVTAPELNYCDSCNVRIGVEMGLISEEDAIAAGVPRSLRRQLFTNPKAKETRKAARRAARGDTRWD